MSKSAKTPESQMTSTRLPGRMALVDYLRVSLPAFILGFSFIFIYIYIKIVLFKKNIIPHFKHFGNSDEWTDRD